MRYTREEGCLAWLTNGMIHGQKLQQLLTSYGSAEALYDTFVKDDGRCLEGKVSDSNLSLLQASASRNAMHDMLVTMQKWNIGILSIADKRYPERLRNIPVPPAILFYRGNLAALEGHALAVVGTRKASSAGLAATSTLCQTLSNENVRIVSGLAVGIDTAAHEGCLCGASPTIGIMACGLNIPYPTASASLRERILHNGGLLLSEYPPDMRPQKNVFSVRNRLLAGLSDAVVVMECYSRSGCKLTVQHALEQGKDVFAYPGIPNAAISEGTHQLIRDGAIYFTTAQDILEDMRWSDPNQPPKPKPAPDLLPQAPAKPAKQKASSAKSSSQKKAISGPPDATSKDNTPPAQAVKEIPLPPMSDEEKGIYDALAEGTLSFDQLSDKTGLAAAKLMSSLTMLQIAGVIKALPGKMYSRHDQQAAED